MLIRAKLDGNGTLGHSSNVYLLPGTPGENKGIHYNPGIFLASSYYTLGVFHLSGFKMKLVKEIRIHFSLRPPPPSHHQTGVAEMTGGGSSIKSEVD